MLKTLLTATLATALLAGCAGMSSINNEVSSHGEWPAGRTPGSYAFDRLPSQQALAAETARIEAAARPALEKAGFQPAAEGQAPDLLVQVGARSMFADFQPWGDPVWWRGGFGHPFGHPFGFYGPGWRGSMWYGPGWGWAGRFEAPRQQYEVALLLRDRASGKPLFESRASSEGFSQLNDALMAAMFEATLLDFPKLGINPRRVVVPLVAPVPSPVPPVPPATPVLPPPIAVKAP